MSFRSAAFYAVVLLLLNACSQPAAEQAAPEAAAVTASELAAQMLDTMGGRAALESVQTLVQKGGGRRYHLGQIPATGAEDPPARLTALTETIDLANQRAAFDNVVEIGAEFSQHRTEAYTTYMGQHLGWGTTEGRPFEVTSVNGIFSWATHNTPEMLLRRNAVTIALVALDASAAVEELDLDDTTYWYLTTQLRGEDVGLYIDKDSKQLKAYSVLDTETMRGDTNATYVLGDWRPVGNVVLPHALEIRKDDGPYASLQYDSITVNDASALAIFEIPDDVTDQADAVIAANGESWVALQWNPVAEHVTHVVAFSHHSMVVEFPTFVVVVEGPYTEAQSLTLARLIHEKIGKPIRYVVPTHPHYDHTGGIRALASVGANVLVAGGHEAELRMLVEAPHTNPPDALARNIAAGAEVGRIEVFSGMTEVTEGDMTLQLFETAGIPHVAPKTLAFVPGSGVLFQSDLFFGVPGPDATALYEAIQRYGLSVQQIVGGHGGVLAYSSLEAAMAPAPAVPPAQ
jgi:glyoxylase-like metal-dependent hydrolase (beta-lactamase superfamily II)